MLKCAEQHNTTRGSDSAKCFPYLITSEAPNKLLDNLKYPHSNVSPRPYSTRGE